MAPATLSRVGGAPKMRRSCDTPWRRCASGGSLPSITVTHLRLHSEPDSHERVCVCVRVCACVGFLGQSGAEQLGSAGRVCPCSLMTDSRTHSFTHLPPTCRCVIVRDGVVVAAGRNSPNVTRNVRAVGVHTQRVSLAALRLTPARTERRPPGTRSFKPSTCCWTHTEGTLQLPVWRSARCM